LTIITSINIETSKSNKINNSQVGLAPSPLLNKTLSDLKSKNVGSFVDRTTHPSGTYNCHGMTFANRRTGIYESSEIYKILTDDNYRQVSIDDTLPGDIALYFDESGDITHSGIVVKEIEAGGYLKIPFIISKMGMLHEVKHSAFICPYDSRNIKYYRCML
jgi:hypothetical protein